MELYKLVPLELYENVVETAKTKTFADDIGALPKATQKKVNRILEIIKEEGIEWNETGKVTTSEEGLNSEEILPLVLYLVKGKERPSTFGNFAQFLGNVKFPKDIVHQKVLPELKKAKKNAKT